MEILIVLLLLIVLAASAWWWGVDSTDGIDSGEWERRRHWHGFAGLNIRGEER